MAQSPKTGVGTGDIEKQLQTIREDVAKLTKLVTQLGEEKLSQSTKSVREEVESLVSDARKTADETAEKVKQTANSIEDHINEKPIQSVIMALILGLFIGSISRR